MNFMHRRLHSACHMRAIIIGALVCPSSERLGMAAIVPHWCYCWYHDCAESPKALLE
jgi:hypothetical protein